MNRLAELQFIDDTLLVESFLLTKEAGLVSDSLGSIANLVKTYVVDKIDTSTPEAIGRSILKLMAPAIIFKVSPILGSALIFASQAFGFSLDTIWDGIKSMIAPKIERGEPVSAGEINQAANQYLSQEATADLFHDLRILQKNGLEKIAQVGGPWLLPKKHDSVLHRIFGFLGPGRGRNLAVGFIAWFIKSILAGAGLLVAAGGITEALGLKYKQEPGQDPSIKQDHTEVFKTPPAQVVPAMYLPPSRSHSLKDSGRGSVYHKNDAQSVWMVPLYGGIKNTLVLWARDVYPELNGKENLIANNSAFIKIVNMLSQYVNSRHPNYLIVPPGLNTRKQIVDLFAGDVSQSIPKQLSEEEVEV